jgi:hypothetical protein
MIFAVFTIEDPFGQFDWDYFLAAFAAIRARNCFSF